MKWTIRPAVADDLPACLALDHTSTSDFVWQVETEHASDAISYCFRTVRLPRPMAVLYPLEPDMILQAWHQRDYFLVAEGEGRIYGYLSLHVDRAYGIGWVKGLVVDRPWRRHRVGSALLMQVQKWARMNNLHRITVETQTKNFPAISFCMRHGLVLSGFNDRYYPNQDIAVFFTQGLR